MKTNFLKAVMVMVIFAISSFSSFSQNTKEKTKKKAEIKTVCFKSNLHCHSCENKVNENISYEKGVKDLEIDLKTNTITIKYKDTKTTEAKLRKAIKELGYDAEIIEVPEK